MTKNGSLNGCWAEVNGVRYTYNLVITNGKVTSCIYVPTLETIVPRFALNVVREKLTAYKIQIEDTSPSLPAKISAGQSVNYMGYLTDGRTCYIDFDKPAWVFDDPDDPGTGSSSVSFDIVVPS